MIKFSRRGALAASLAIVGSVLSSVPAVAQDSFATKPIRIVVPFLAGSASDSLARSIGHLVTAETGQAVVVDNRPGGNGFIAVQAVTSAPADGHTLLLGGTSTHSANPGLFLKLPYDPVNDLAPVTPLGKGWLVVVANKDLPIKNLAEFIAYTKARPGKVFMGAGTPGLRVPGELLKQMAGLESVTVPYKGSPAAITDLMAGQVQWAVIDVGTATPFIKSGQLRALGMTNNVRYPGLPDVPTVAEAGVAGYELSNWLGIFAPAKTPPATLERLNKLFVNAANNPAAEERVYTAGAMSKFTAPAAEVPRFIAADADKWQTIMRNAGIPKE